MSPSFLNSNSTSHTWPFSAVAELIGEWVVLLRIANRTSWEATRSCCAPAAAVRSSFPRCHSSAPSHQRFRQEDIKEVPSLLKKPVCGLELVVVYIVRNKPCTYGNIFSKMFGYINLTAFFVILVSVLKQKTESTRNQDKI